MNKEEEIINILTTNLGMTDYIDVTKYLSDLEEENQKYKEVIDKAMALVNNEIYRNRCDCKFCNDYYLKNMRDILKEVE